MTLKVLPDYQVGLGAGINPAFQRIYLMESGDWSSEPLDLFRCNAFTNPVAALRPALPIMLTRDRIQALWSLPEREQWPGAQRPADTAFMEALAFIENLPMPLRALPYISLANDGEVNFAWVDDQVRVDLGFYGTGVYSYYGVYESGNESVADDIPVGDPIPQELRDLLVG